MAKRTPQQVTFDNIRDQQIGGVTDGITPEVAADIGYEIGPLDTERVARLRGALDDLGSLATTSTEQDDVIARGKKLAKDVVNNPEGRSPGAQRRQEVIDYNDQMAGYRAANRKRRK